MIQLLLYTTSYCHLCEQAEALLVSLRDSYQLQWQAIEISDDDELMSRYGTRIPVIQRHDSNAELGWPFDKQAVKDFLGLSELTHK